MPGDWPLLDDFAMSELREQSVVNLVHTCDVESTADSGRTWSAVTNGNDVACRLMKPTPDELHGVADTLVRTAHSWVVAFPAGSVHARPRVRYVVSGAENGVAFTRTVYSIGLLTPIAYSAESRVLCTEDPA